MGSTNNQEITQGLLKTPKTISSKFFYDQRGSELFVQIMGAKEYYLTDCEKEIFLNSSSKISGAIDQRIEQVIEFGAGDGLKTEVLMSELLKKEENLHFYPIDISAEAIRSLSARFKKSFPNLKIEGIESDYFHLLKEGTFPKIESTGKKRLVLFLGSNLGNLSEEVASSFLKLMCQQMNQGDYFLIGLDLKKDIQVMHDAYNDSQGLTREFNLNLLTRINRECDGNFQLQDFEHYGFYNPTLGAMQSFLISKKVQKVEIKSLGQEIEFDYLEPIHVEDSFKYSFHDVDSMARESGFEVVENFTDQKEYFVSSLWRKK